ncbi:MAG: amidohydrolase [Deltaproteobacteria bacterium]|nr:MAG: amidohydrolase [Deltaproteobacteria bacterium]
MIIDFHTHIFPPFFRDQRDLFFPEEPAFESLYRSPESKLVGRKELLQNMDEEGVHRSVIFGFPWQKDEHFRRHNDYIIESVERYPDRFVGFCCFSPLSSSGPKEAVRCLEAGLSGAGELAIYHSDLSPEEMGSFQDIMKICAQYEVPLLLHTNEPVGHQYPGKRPINLSQLYNFLKAYPSNRIVLAHWGGGLFFYGLMKKEVREVLKNVWFDTAASPYLYAPDIYRVASEIIGHDKILFGSDYPLLKPGRYFEEMGTSDLSAESFKGIAGENAARLLGISK